MGKLSFLAESEVQKPEILLRSILDACADCDSCRHLMQEHCLFFAELYRLYDREKSSRKKPGAMELLRMAQLCTYCGLCPCPFVPDGVQLAKARQVQQEGLGLSKRAIAHVQTWGRLCTSAPRLVQGALQVGPLKKMAEWLGGLHPQRELPELPRQSFFAWAREQGLHKDQERSCQVAYFAGCSAGYFFPQVARAAVQVLERNQIQVYVPWQQCCGMPAFLEGDACYALQKAQDNMQSLLQAIQKGYVPVCSCPTCSYMFRVLLKEHAWYSQANQELLQAGAGEVVIQDAQGNVKRLQKALCGHQYEDNGYFSEIDPLQRMDLSRHIMDLGDYLQKLHKDQDLDTDFRALDWDMVHFVPCHQREQFESGRSPYQELLALIPGLRLRRVGGIMDCCGMGGNQGFKQDFHQDSVELARPLLRKIRAAAPQGIITECLSCRLQFEHLQHLPVWHPLEVLQEAYCS